MNKRKKKLIFTFIVMIASIILLAVGSTFAYFSATIASETNAVSLGAAVFTMELEDDVSLIKTKLIPSAEKYVDASTIKRLDENKNFIKPHRENEEFIYAKTACIDDNLNEICSIYTFTIINSMTDMELPLYVTLIPSVNTFENLHIKVVDDEKNVIMEKTPIKTKDIFEEQNPEDETDNEKLNNVHLTGIKTLPPATEEGNNIIPSKATYSIIMWIDETGNDQTKQDSGQLFAGKINIMASDENGGGITGVFSAGGTE